MGATARSNQRAAPLAFRCARALLLAACSVLLAVLAWPSAAAEGDYSLDSTPLEAHVWGGAVNWTAVSVELPDAGPDVRVLVEFHEVELGPGQEPLARSDWISLRDFARATTNTTIDRLIDVRETLIWLSPGPTQRLNLYLSVDWRYNSTEHARLWLCVKNETWSIVICHSTPTVVYVHARLTWPMEPRLWSEGWGDYSGGSWVNKSTVMHLEARWPVYEGTGEPAPRVGRIWHTSFSSGQSSSDPTGDLFIVRWNLTFSNRSGTEDHELLLEPFYGIDPPDPRSALVRTWNILVDDDPPYADDIYPPPGTAVLSGSPTASIGMVACDDASGLSLGADAATIEEASGAVAASVAGYVDRRGVGSPCVEILFQIDPPTGSTNWTITLRDAVGNSLRVEDLRVRRLPDGIAFSEPAPDGPLPVLTFRASVRARAMEGARVDLSSVEWSLTDGPADPRVWRSADLSGASPDTVLAVALALPRSESFYLQWSASLEGSTERILSPMYIVTGDTEPPFAANLSCAPTGAGVTAQVRVTVGDNTTVVNWGATYVTVVGAGGEETRVGIGHLEPLDAIRGAASFDVPLRPGTQRIRVVAHDAVGNPLAETACAVEGPASPAPAPSPGPVALGTEPWLLLVLLVGASALLVFSVRRRAGRRDGG